MKISVIGAGSWGTALAMVLDDSGHDVMLWAREPEIAAYINQHHQNPSYLKEIELPESIKSKSDLKAALSGHQPDVIIYATPSHVLRSVAKNTLPYLSGNEIVCTVAKGIENDTFMTMSQVLRDVLKPSINPDNISVLYGPSHAEEVALRKPTAVVTAAYASSTAKTIQELFSAPMFRVYLNNDVIGIEVAGSIKNIMAIAAGIADGANMGDNAIAALVTRGLQEMKRLGVRLGASQDTFAGLSGIGDLVVTCCSRHSRNRQVGHRIGKGEKLDDIINSMNMVAEGVKTTRSVYGWAKKLNVEMPITEAVYAVLFEGLEPREGVFKLMTRQQKEEILF